MKTVLFLIFLTISTVSRVNADTLTLKSGEIIEGNIIAESNDVIQISVPNARHTIFSEKAINRSDVREVVHASAEQKAYEEVESYRLGLNGFPAEYYSQKIQKIFQRFLSDYPDSPRTGSVADKIVQWQAEHDKIVRGAVKWGGRWYEGDAVKTIAGQVKAAQLIEEGMRLVGAKKYEEAIAKYREALAIRPLPINTIDLIDAKLTVAADLWKNTVVADITAECSTIDSENQSLTANRSVLQNAITQATTYRQYILNAKNIPVSGKPYIKHWYSDGYGDFGSVLPDPAPITSEINVKQITIKNIDEKIAANNDKKLKLQSEHALAKERVVQINSMQQQFNSSLAQARSDTRRLEAEASRQKTKESISTAVAPAVTQTQISPSQVTGSPTVVTTAATLTPRQSCWTWLHDNWVLLLIGGIPLLYLILRWLD